MVTPLLKVKIYPGLSFPCEQSENIEQFRVNKMSGQIFQMVENSSGTVRTYPDSTGAEQNVFVFGTRTECVTGRRSKPH